MWFPYGRNNSGTNAGLVGIPTASAAVQINSRDVTPMTGGEPT